MNISKFKKMYDNNELNRISFSNFMYEFYHSKLYEYKDYLKNHNVVKNISISSENIIFEINLFDTTIRLISKDGEIMSFPLYLFNTMEYETDEMNTIVSSINDNDVILDIGTNIGLYTILLNKLKKIKTYSFEPIPFTFNILKENIRLNGLDVEIFNIGISNKNETVDFYFNTSEIASSSMKDLRENKENTEIVKCQIRKLDDFIKENNINKIDFMKIDIEGSELFAIQGGLESIKKFKPIIFCEMLRKWCKKFNYHPNDIIKLLVDIGYSCYAISNKLNKIDFVDDNTIETNFLFLDLNKERHIEKLNLING